MKIFIVSGIIILISLTKSFSQEVAQYKKDVSSIENIVEALLESISGNKGQKRDWKRFEHLFLPSAQLHAVFYKGDSSWVKINTLKEFTQKAGTWYEDNGFTEYSYKNTIERFGNIAHVFQSYGAKLSNEKEIERGMNSYQLVYDKGRWWIVNVIWDSETKSNVLPEKYLK